MKIRFILFTSLLLTSAFAPAQTTPLASEPELAQQFDSGLLWKIDNGSSNPSFLFGTMHVEDPRITELPGPVLETFNNSTSLTTEALLDLEQMLQAGTELLLMDGSSLQGLIGAELFGKISAALTAQGMPPQVASLLKPWAVAILLTQPQAQTGQFLDRKLYDLAQQQGKSLFGLETLQEQLQVFNTMSIKDQITLLEETLAELSMIPEIIEQLTQAYLARDLKQLTTLANEQFSQSRVQRQLRQQLLIDRNLKMVNRMQARIREGSAFIAVGALHLSGPQGLLYLLQQMGFELTRVY